MFIEVLVYAFVWRKQGKKNLKITLFGSDGQ